MGASWHGGGGSIIESIAVCAFGGGKVLNASVDTRSLKTEK
jgi:hypothetical protein